MSGDSLEDNILLSTFAVDSVATVGELDGDLKGEREHKRDSVQERAEKLFKDMGLNYIGQTDYKRLNPKENTLIIASSALKCTRILSELKYLNKKIGKLFAKHLKFKDQLLKVQERPCKINVGTPNRLAKLGIKAKKVIIDASLDVKGFSILDIHDTKRDLLLLLENCKDSRIFIIC